MSWLNTLNDKLVGAAIAGVGIMIVMWRDISLLKLNVANHKDTYRTEMDEVKRSADRNEAAVKALEARMAAQDVTLGRIDENIKTILGAIHAPIGSGSAIGK